MGTAVITEGKLELAKAGEKYDIRKTGERSAEFCREGTIPADGVVHFGHGAEALLVISRIPPTVRHELVLDENELAEPHKNAEGRWQLHFVERRNAKISLYRLADKGIKAEIASPSSRAFVQGLKGRAKEPAGRSATRALRRRTREKNGSPA